MKAPAFPFPPALAAAIVCGAGLLPASLDAAEPEWTILDAGPNHREIEWVAEEADAAGHRSRVTHSYVELEPGLCYAEPGSGKWVPSRAEFEQAESGHFVARQTQFQVILAPDLGEAGAVDVLTPEGVRLVSTPRGIALLDVDSGKSVMLGEVGEGKAEWVAPGEVIYRDAIPELGAHLRFRIQNSGFHQDVLLEEEIPPELVADLGFNPLRTRVLVLSEFFDAPTPIERGDGRVDFGGMHIGPGQAFRVEGREEAVASAEVRPSWEVLEGRRFLVERVEYTALEPLMEALERLGQGRIETLRSRVGRTASVVPPARLPSMGRRLERAAIDPGRLRPWSPRLASVGPGLRRGVVWDYALELSTGQSNYVFCGDKTYYIKASIPLEGVSVFEAGCVIKFAPTNSARLQVRGPITWQGAPYRPVVLTARDDGSVGEAVYGAGTLNNYYASVALEIDRSTNASAAVLGNFRIAHAQTAIALNGRSGHVFSHGQVVNCQGGLSLTNAEASLRNVLFHNVLTNLGGTASTGRCEHLTVNRAAWFNGNGACTVLTLTNCLLAGVTNTGFGAGTITEATPVLASADGVFQTMGQGANYLAAGSPYRNYAGASTDLNGELAQALRNLTTYPPVELTGDFTVDTVLGPQAGREGGGWDLGYHYDPLDWIWSGRTLTNATLVLTNGVAVGVYGSKGLTLRNGAKLVSEGSPRRLNRLVRYPAVQEQPGVWGTNTSTMSLIEPATASPLPEVRLRFTDVSLLADTANRRQVMPVGAAIVSVFEISHSQVRGGSFGVCSMAGTGMVVGWTNTVFERCGVTFSQGTTSSALGGGGGGGSLLSVPGYSPFTLNLCNDLFRKGTVTFTDLDTGSTWTVRENLFDVDTLSNYSSSSSFLPSYNGYRSGLSSLGGAGNKTGLTMDYQGGVAGGWYGVLGGFYYRTNGGTGSLTSLINAGGVASAGSRGLYHFTTTTNQVKDGSTTLDIGFHYVAAEPATGLPCDSDGDGLADYAEDRNGNGDVDSGETDWQSAGDNGLRVWITRPPNPSPVP